MSAQPSALAHTYTCNVCRRTLTLQGPPIIGEQPIQRMARVAQMMFAHFEGEHKKESINLGIAGQQYAGWALTQQFKTNDAELAAESNKARLQFRLHTKRVHISDEVIEKQIATHLADLTPEQQAKLLTLLRTMRDSLDEVQIAAK
jgi:hypothetical protein